MSIQIRSIYEHIIHRRFPIITTIIPYATIEELSQAEVNLSNKKALEIDVSDTDIKVYYLITKVIEDYSFSGRNARNPIYSFFRNKKNRKISVPDIRG